MFLGTADKKWDMANPIEDGLGLDVIFLVKAIGTKVGSVEFVICCFTQIGLGFIWCFPFDYSPIRCTYRHVWPNYQKCFKNFVDVSASLARGRPKATENRKDGVGPVAFRMGVQNRRLAHA